MKEPERPIVESYWVEPDHLLAGEYPANYDSEHTRQRIDSLLQAGFNTFIDLTNPNETVAYKDLLLDEAKLYEVTVQHYRFSISDFGLPTPVQMRDILNKIDEELKAGHKIYLHCWGGIGRTGTTVGCYLVRRGKSGDEALRQLAKWWQTVPKSQIHSHSPETREQVEFILNWAKYENNPRNIE